MGIMNDPWGRWEKWPCWCSNVKFTGFREGEWGVLLIVRYWYNHQRVLNDLWRIRLSRRRLNWFLLHLLPTPLPVCKFDRRHTERLSKRYNSLTGAWGGGGNERGAKSYDGEKAWFSINHSIRSGYNCIKHIQCMGPSRRPFSRLSTKVCPISNKSTKLCGKKRRESWKMPRKLR
jgi:hypothetical protein